MKANTQSNAFVRFLITASAAYLVSFLIYQFIIKRYTLYDQAFIGTIVKSTAFCLNSLGYKTFMVLQDRDMQVVGIDGSNGVWVGSNCNAITLFALFAVFILTYPGNQKNKLWFIPLGIVLIHLLNILRVTALALISNYSPQWLDFNHTYTFTFLVYLFIFMLWVYWINKFASTSSAK
ncbi:MAG: archaeosortase/exosortase family protein [Bacteroidia bacterium]|nr:archaeosortase/exosortase family protein [Bacteroidia bacterium]